MGQTPCCPQSPFQALVVDRDGHGIGLFTTRPGDGELPGSAALVAAQSFHAAGALSRTGDLRAATFDGPQARLILVPLALPGFVLVAATACSVEGSDACEAALRCGEELSAALSFDDGASDSFSPCSLLLVTPETADSVLGSLARLLRKLGCPRSVLEVEAVRLQQQELLLALSRGSQQEALLRYLGALCRSADLAAPLDTLGSGSWGTAFRLDDGNVLKLTRDVGEALACASLVGLDVARMPRIHRVFQVSAAGCPLAVFGIVRDLVDQAGALVGDLAEAAELACDILIAARGQPWSRALEDCALRRKQEVTADCWQSAIRFAWELHTSLDEHGVRLGDFRPANIGLRGGELCFFDLSLAQAPPASWETIAAPPVSSEHGQPPAWWTRF